MPKKKKLKLSYSKAKTYECPMKFFFKYVKRLPDKSNSRNSLPGRAIQKLFELYCNRGGFSQGSQWLYDNVESVFDGEYTKLKSSTRFYTDETYEDVLHEVVDMIGPCYDLFVRKKWNEAKVESEIWIEALMSQTVKLVGSIDFVIEAKKSIIIDFKSTSKGISALDKEQLIIYNYLYKSKFGRYPDETYFFLCRDNKLVRLNVTQKMVDQTVEKLLKSAEGISNGDFHKNPSKSNCRFCPYKKQCWGSYKNCPW